MLPITKKKDSVPLLYYFTASFVG